MACILTQWGWMRCILPVALLLLLIGSTWPAVAGFSDNYVQYVVSNQALGVFSVDAHDINGDGQVDILGAMRTNGNLTWWQNMLEEGGSWQEWPIDRNAAGAQNAAAADIDADGDLDVVSAAAIADEVAWYRNENGAGMVWTKILVAANFNGARWVIAADFDADNDLDIAGCAGWDNLVTWWENQDGTGGIWLAHPIDSSFGGAHSLAAADIDGDGDLDLLGAAFWDHEIGWWENLGGQGLTWSYHVIATGFWNAISAEAGDIDGDGDLDVVGAAFGACDVGWWKNVNGNGLTWVYRKLDAEFSGAHNIVLADMDHDLDLDVVSPASGGDEVAWWKNLTGSGWRWSKISVTTTIDGPVNVDVADFNSDGLLDVVAAGFVGNTIAWWPAQP